MERFRALSTAQIIDISWPLSAQMTAYKDRPEKRLERTLTRSHATGGAEESRLALDSHTGTHVDYPRHFFPRGKTSEQMPLTSLVGLAHVFSIRSAVITEKEIAALPIQKDAIILFKTRNSQKRETAPFDPRFVYVDASAAAALAQRRVKAVGLDYLSIERDQPGHETHTILLRRNIPIIEGLRLGHVKPGTYGAVIAPLKVVGADAAPARAVLISVHGGFY